MVFKPKDNSSNVRFLLSVEISTIYKKGDKTRKVHHVVLVPDIAAAEKFKQRLSTIGNICLTPEESTKLGGICPVCKKPLTIGVLNRVNKLADRKGNITPPLKAGKVFSLGLCKKSLQRLCKLARQANH